MNVALTRARSSLFILGNAETLRRKKIWGNLVRDAEERGFFTKVKFDAQVRAEFNSWRLCNLWANKYSLY